MRRISLIALGLATLAASGGEVASRAPIDLRGRPVSGQETARMVVIEGASFKGAHGRAFHPTIFPQLWTEDVASGKVRWVVRNASDDPAEEFAPIVPIAWCAQRQGNCWELLDRLCQVAYRPPSSLTDLVAPSPGVDRLPLVALARACALFTGRVWMLLQPLPQS